MSKKSHINAYSDFFHCDSFDHDALRSLNKCIMFVFLDSPTDTLVVPGRVIYYWKRSQKYLSNGISHGPKHLILQSQNEE